jgi:hypothetical protein
MAWSDEDWLIICQVLNTIAKSIRRMEQEERKSQEVSMPEEEGPCLQSEYGRWQAASPDNLIVIWVSYKTFSKHADAWLKAKGITLHDERRMEALREVSKWSYWMDRKGDPEVHIQYFGIRASQEQQRQRLVEKQNVSE